ncbi:MAG: xanthine dehydrogenase molybdopterin binding subunit [Candidatus Puniceispirillaceae bacterium]
MKGEAEKLHDSLHQPIAHDSAALYVTGAAQFTDDIAFPEDGLHIALGLSAVAHAKLISLDLTDVLAADGVVCCLSAEDITGKNDASPVFGDDPVFAKDMVSYHGQSVFAVVAHSAKQARMAALKAQIVYEELPAILDIDSALAQNSLLRAPQQIVTGDVDAGLADAPHRMQGQMVIGGQEHFYLEGQAAIAIPGEAGELSLYVSTQHPTEIQHKVAEALGRPFHQITVQVRRMGGAFGGKESQANLPAIIAALAAAKTGKPAKLVYDRDEDMRVTGKRHDFKISYNAGFDDDGVIQALDVHQALRCGMSFDLSAAIADRAMMHAENAYGIAAMRIRSSLCKTNTPSNTAFRGFGGPQGVLGMERVIDDIAAYLGIDPFLVRQRNFYPDKQDMENGKTTPYGQPVTDCIIGALTTKLAADADYQKRRAEIEQWNENNPILRRGIALTPVKFGISFNKTMLNQAGALVHIYTDGTIHLNHGGTEMGQGLFTKIAQICSHAFGVSMDKVAITPTNTGKVPNSSATAASSGTDLNGMAVAAAADTIKSRMAAYLASQYQADPSEVGFSDGKVIIGKESLSFAEAAMQCWQGRISLSATGFYATPDIHWDAKSLRGAPFYYFAYGAAVSEVAVDRLTGENRILRVDILHDVGHSINPALDHGQIEGGFIQGAGWLTTEELVYGKDGRLQTHAPSTYKIPACSDRPAILNIGLYSSGGNPADTIHKSKAVGEPPFMLAASVHSALRHAIEGLAEARLPNLDAPATAEQLLMTLKGIAR